MNIAACSAASRRNGRSRGSNNSSNPAGTSLRSEAPRRWGSGWGWGQQYLDGGTVVAEAQLGEGKVTLLGPEVAFRGQPHATFKLLFNGVYYGSARETPLE